MDNNVIDFELLRQSKKEINFSVNMIKTKRRKETKRSVIKWLHSISGLPGHIDPESPEDLDWNVKFTDRKVWTYRFYTF